MEILKENFIEEKGNVRKMMIYKLDPMHLTEN